MSLAHPRHWNYGVTGYDNGSRLVPGYAPDPLSDPTRLLREVWSWNLDAEFDELLAAAMKEDASVIAFDTEFPGIVREPPRSPAREAQYQALRESVDLLWPIQFGAAVAGADGVLRGVWVFNLRFDATFDLHTAAAVEFLGNAGINFPRHAVEGIEVAKFGELLAGSKLVGECVVCWVTFSGTYDWGFLLKLLTGEPLPGDADAFDAALSSFCPRRHELREQLPHGSLDRLGWDYGLQRCGHAHNAGSDALVTLELYMRVVPASIRNANIRRTLPAAS